MNSQIDTLNSQIESMQLPKTSFSFWMGIVVMIAAFFILVAGYFYWFMAYITPIILKKKLCLNTMVLLLTDIHIVTVIFLNYLGIIMLLFKQ